MNATLYNNKKQYASELLAELNEREENGEFDGSRNTLWARRYDAFEVAVVDLAQEIGGEYSISDLPELAEIYDVLAGFVFGNVHACFCNEDGDCELSEAIEAHICATGCNADYFQAPCAHTCMGSTIVQYIIEALDPREFRGEYSEHVLQRDESTLINLAK
jgi:hypothetical protein